MSKVKSVATKRANEKQAIASREAVKPSIAMDTRYVSDAVYEITALTHERKGTSVLKNFTARQLAVMLYLIRECVHVGTLSESGIPNADWSFNAETFILLFDWLEDHADKDAMARLQETAELPESPEETFLRIHGKELARFVLTDKNRLREFMAFTD